MIKFPFFGRYFCAMGRANKHFLRFLALLLMSCSTIFSQKKQSEYDILEKKIFEKSTDQQQSFEFAKKYLALAKKQDSTEKIFFGYMNLSTISVSDTDKMKYADSLLNFSIKSKDNRAIGLSYGVISEIYLKQYDYSNSLEKKLIAYDYLKADDSKEYAYVMEMEIAELKIMIGQYQEAKDILERVSKYFRWKITQKSSPKNYSQYVGSLNRLICANANLGNFKENVILINEVNNFYKNHKDFNWAKTRFTFTQGYNDYLQKKYTTAIIKIKKSLEMSKFSDKRDLTQKFYLGMAYWRLNKPEAALPFFSEIENEYTKTGRISIEFRPIFEFFIEYYKNNGERERQLEYVDMLLNYDRKFESEQKNLVTKIETEYDEKRLKEEKEKIKSDRKMERLAFAGFVFVSLAVLIFYIFYRKERKKITEANKIENIDEYSNVTIDEKQHDNGTLPTMEENFFVTPVPSVLKKKTSSRGDEPDFAAYYPINEQTVKQILKNLNNFEKKKIFLRKNIRLVDLANEFNTNDKYLARTIKVKTGKTFSYYITDLRLSYLEQLIETDPSVKKRKIKEISDGLGFSTPELFTNLFKEKHGVAPTVYFNENNTV